MNLNKILCFILFCVMLQAITYGQNEQQKQMYKLNHLVGDWVGTSTAFKNGEIVRQIPAYEKISYKVDSHILTIDLYSESLKLHTVVYYDAKDSTYYYNPFYKSGTARYPAELKDGKLIVSPNSTKRFIFEITEDGQFREYGENLIDGKWVKYFEDIFDRQ